MRVKNTIAYTEMNGNRGILSRKPLVNLIFGILIGFSMAVLFITKNPCKSLRDDLADAEGPLQDVGTHSSYEGVHALENNTLAEQLYNEVKVLCWVMTNPKNHQRKAKHVLKTWGTRCNKLIFMSSVEDKELGSVALPVKEGRKYLWGKTKEAFKYIYNNHINDADWFVKADDDTYVILENLRYMLYPYSPDHPIYFGCKFKPYVKQGYMSGGAGYVLSKEAVRRLVEDGIPNKDKCWQLSDGEEDVELGLCLENVNVFAGDSRDDLGRGRFFPFVPAHHLIPGHPQRSFWYWRYTFYESEEGLNCCSDNAISFHYISPNQMYTLDYLIYHLRPYGIVAFSQPLPDKLSFNEVIGDGKQTH